MALGSHFEVLVLPLGIRFCVGPDLKILPKMLSGISQNYVLSVFLLCLHYAPKLATFVTIMFEQFNL